MMPMLAFLTSSLGISCPLYSYVRFAIEKGACGFLSESLTNNNFQMFHLQELLGVKSLHSEISCGTRDIPEKKKVTNEPMTQPCIMILKSFATLEHVKLVEARSAF